MSLIGSLNTAVGGMSAQSAALSNISDNVANSQTVGFKATNTTFADYVTGANTSGLAPNMVVARAQYTNSQQGSVTQVTSPTSIAISGAGFFAVQRPTGTTAAGVSTFSPQSFYTRVGDFQANSAGFLINSTGFALNGWTANPAGAATQFNTNTIAPIQISKAPSVPVPTSNIAIAANLPSTPLGDTVTTPLTSTVPIYDAGGNAQVLNLSWSQVGSVTAGGPITSANPAIPNQWNLTVTGGAPTGTPAAVPSTGPMLVTFGATATNAGEITSITMPATAGTLAATAPAVQTSGNAALIGLPISFGLGSQPVGLNLGNFGTTTGVTQFAGSSYQVTSQSQNGSTQGNYSSVTIKPTGDVLINYDNGSSATVARIPLVNFNNPNGLQMQDGQTYSVSSESGSPNILNGGTGGAGTMVVGAVESSNVDIATEFTNMIVAQRAYTANSKVITTANTLMQDTLNIVQG